MRDRQGRADDRRGLSPQIWWAACGTECAGELHGITEWSDGVCDAGAVLSCGEEDAAVRAAADRGEIGSGGDRLSGSESAGEWQRSEAASRGGDSGGWAGVGE